MQFLFQRRVHVAAEKVSDVLDEKSVSLYEVIEKEKKSPLSEILFKGQRVLFSEEYSATLRTITQMSFRRVALIFGEQKAINQ